MQIHLYIFNGGLSAHILFFGGQLYIWIEVELPKQRALMLLFLHWFISLAVSKDVRREEQAGVHRSPLDTPAPRKVIPKPTHWTSSTSTIKPQRSSLKNQGRFLSCIIFSVKVFIGRKQFGL